MPVRELKVANEAMRTCANRAILLTTVNASNEAPRLEPLLAELKFNTRSWDSFYKEIKEKLIVTSFEDFLNKFKPCYYYKLLNPEDQEEVQEGAEPLTEDQEKAKRALKRLPRYQFSLTGGPDWKRVVVDADSAFITSLRDLMADRKRRSGAASDVDINTALFGLKPEAEFKQTNRAVDDYNYIATTLLQSVDQDGKFLTEADAKLLQQYEQVVEHLRANLTNEFQIVGLLTHGIKSAYNNQFPDEDTSATAIGASNNLSIGSDGFEAKPKIEGAANEAQLHAIEGAPDTTDTNTRNALITLQEAVEYRQLARIETRQALTLPAKRNASGAIVRTAEQVRRSALVDNFVATMIEKGEMEPKIGKLVATILDGSMDLTSLLPETPTETGQMIRIDPKSIALAHDVMLGLYSRGIWDFLQAVMPLYETIMGVHALFNELPEALKGRKKLELLVANSELSDLWNYRKDEFKAFMQQACLQTSNYYQDAFSFAIVPSVEPFKKQNAAPIPEAEKISASRFQNQYLENQGTADDSARLALSREIDAMRQRRVKKATTYGLVTGAAECLGLMALGEGCGFQVFFSPEKRLVAGRFGQNEIDALTEGYTPRAVVTKSYSDCGVLCLPDFVCVPPNGELVTGTVIDGRHVVVRVPSLNVRSCYVAAGRLMANDFPEVLLQTFKGLDSETLRSFRTSGVNDAIFIPELPGVAVDIKSYPVFGITNLATDHFFMEPTRNALRKTRFFVFDHITGKNVQVLTPRTLRDLSGEFRLIHQFRQETYLKRLLNAARREGVMDPSMGVTAGPSDLDERAVWSEMGDLLFKTGWYNPAFLNSFPSRLTDPRDMTKLDQDPLNPTQKTCKYISKSGSSILIRLPYAQGSEGEMEIDVAGE